MFSCLDVRLLWFRVYWVTNGCFISSSIYVLNFFVAFCCTTSFPKILSFVALGNWNHKKNTILILQKLLFNLRFSLTHVTAQWHYLTPWWGLWHCILFVRMRQIFLILDTIDVYALLIQISALIKWYFTSINDRLPTSCTVIIFICSKNVNKLNMKISIVSKVKKIQRIRTKKSMSQSLSWCMTFLQHFCSVSMLLLLLFCFLFSSFWVRCTWSCFHLLSK